MKGLFLGKEIESGKDFVLPVDVLKKHLVALGSSGSGKTVLCKAVIEEAAKAGIPSILVDPQGDLASLAVHGEEKGKAGKGAAKAGSNEKKTEGSFHDSVRVVVFTPTSSKGIPLCINPLKLPGKDFEREEIVSILQQVSSSTAKLLGYDLDNDEGKAAQAITYVVLDKAWKEGRNLSGWDDFAERIRMLSPESAPEAAPFLKDAKSVEKLVKKIKYLTIGEKELLFHFGVPLDINTLLGKDFDDGRAHVSVIYLNSINSHEEKLFFLSTLCTSLYEWMLSNPKPEVQALFYVDEVSPYIPAGSEKPVTKPIMSLLFKQARKYGVGCIISTQNPGDVDYKAFAQFGTWAIGRLTTRQDQEKVRLALKSLSGDIDAMTGKLPSLTPGHFLLFSPDAFDEVKLVGVRWLLTQHKTLTEEDVKKIIDPELRSHYETLYSQGREGSEGRGSEGLAEGGKESGGVSGRAQGTTQGTIQGLKHFALRVTKAEATDAIEKSKKKKFILFGAKSENVASMNLVLEPYVRAVIRRQEKKMLGLRNAVSSYDVFFDGRDGVPVSVSRGAVKRYDSFSSVFPLTNAEISCMKILLDKRSRMTSTEVAGSLGLTQGAANKTLNDLKDKKMASYEVLKGAYLWVPIARIDVPDLPGLSSSQASGEVTAGGAEFAEAEARKASFDRKKVEDAVRAWFRGAEIVSMETVYYPVYEAVLVSGKGERKVRISGITGKEMKD